MTWISRRFDDATLPEMNKRVIEISSDEEEVKKPKTEEKPESKAGRVPSPIHLTQISDLPPSENVDTVTLRGLIGSKNLIEMVREGQ